MTWQYWKHDNGDIYAVRTEARPSLEDEQFAIVEACGPLHHSEVTIENLRAGNFNGSSEDGDWVQENSDAFTLYEGYNR